jgi:hypothetical protein
MDGPLRADAAPVVLIETNCPRAELGHAGGTPASDAFVAPAPPFAAPPLPAFAPPAPVLPLIAPFAPAPPRAVLPPLDAAPLMPP